MDPHLTNLSFQFPQIWPCWGLRQGDCLEKESPMSSEASSLASAWPRSRLPWKGRPRTGSCVSPFLALPRAGSHKSNSETPGMLLLTPRPGC